MSELTEKVDQIFAAWDKPGSPGCSLAVIKDGAIVYKKGYGYANLEYEIPNSPSTIFHIASVSKHFAALAITHLAAQGKLSIDDDIHKYLPEVPDFGEKITIRHLIHHTSGLRDQWELLILAGWRMDDVITTEDILDVVTKQRELNFKPGDEYTYCNTGYTLLGLIVQIVTGKSLREYCAAEIFEPLGMKSTHFHDDHEMIVPNRAYSYHPCPGGGFKNSVLSYANAGATSLFTTVEDLALWDQNFYTGKVGGMAVIEQMHCQGMLNNGDQIPYAFGLMIGKYRGLRVVEHGGADAGYRTVLTRFPDQHFTVAILCNLSTMAPADLARKVADLYLEQDFLEQKVEPVTTELPQEALEKLAGFYVNEAKGATFQLKMNEKKLLVDLGPGLALVPLGPNHFTLAGQNGIELTFIPGVDGESTKMEMKSGFMPPDTYRLVTPTEYSEKELACFGGLYYSPELDVSYRFMVEDGKLQIKRRKYAVMALQPTLPDRFTGEMVDIQFYRDAKNHPAGFLVSSGRVRNLRFERQKS